MILSLIVFIQVRILERTRSDWEILDAKSRRIDFRAIHFSAMKSEDFYPIPRGKTNG